MPKRRKRGDLEAAYAEAEEEAQKFRDILADFDEERRNRMYELLNADPPKVDQWEKEKQVFMRRNDALVDKLREAEDEAQKILDMATEL